MAVAEHSADAESQGISAAWSAPPAPPPGMERLRALASRASAAEHACVSASAGWPARAAAAAASEATPAFGGAPTAELCADAARALERGDWAALARAVEAWSCSLDAQDGPDEVAAVPGAADGATVGGAKSLRRRLSDTLAERLRGRLRGGGYDDVIRHLASAVVAAAESKEQGWAELSRVVGAELDASSRPERRRLDLGSGMGPPSVVVSGISATGLSTHVALVTPTLLGVRLPVPQDVVASLLAARAAEQLRLPLDALLHRSTVTPAEVTGVRRHVRLFLQELGAGFRIGTAAADRGGSLPGAAMLVTFQEHLAASFEPANDKLVERLLAWLRTAAGHLEAASDISPIALPPKPQYWPVGGLDSAPAGGDSARERPPFVEGCLGGALLAITPHVDDIGELPARMRTPFASAVVAVLQRVHTCLEDLVERSPQDVPALLLVGSTAALGERVACAMAAAVRTPVHENLVASPDMPPAAPDAGLVAAALEVSMLLGSLARNVEVLVSSAHVETVALALDDVTSFKWADHRPPPGLVRDVEGAASGGVRLWRQLVVAHAHELAERCAPATAERLLSWALTAGLVLAKGRYEGVVPWAATRNRYAADVRHILATVLALEGAELVCVAPIKLPTSLAKRESGSATPPRPRVSGEGPGVVALRPPADPARGRLCHELCKRAAVLTCSADTLIGRLANPGGDAKAGGAETVDGWAWLPAPSRTALAMPTPQLARVARPVAAFTVAEREPGRAAGDEWAKLVGSLVARMPTESLRAVGAARAELIHEDRTPLDAEAKADKERIVVAMAAS